MKPIDNFNTHTQEWLQKNKLSGNELLINACFCAKTLANEYETSEREPLIAKGLAIASQLLLLNSDSQTLAAALIYPVFQQSSVNSETLSKLIDASVLKLLLSTKRMEMIDRLSKQDSQFTLQRNLIDNLRKMLLAMVDDIRIVLIKLAERLTTLKNLRGQAPAQQKKMAQQVMDIYAPLANRLGIGQFKWQMEDWAFRYLDPENYSAISKSLNMRRADREAYIQRIIQLLSHLLDKENIKDLNIAGRPKHIYSIYRKIQRKHIDVNQVYDSSAVRVLVPSISDCYTILSIVHTTWEHIPEEFDDYIAKPKPNGYRSIHTAIIGPDNHPIEIQIRTYDMHKESELGIAAHWKYKEGKKVAASYEEKILWLRDVMGWQQDALYQKIFEDRVYVFTPKGDVLDLKTGATPLDMAYHIHTEIGHRCRGAKVNEVMVPLTHSLQTGDRVEILTVKTGHPSRDWINPHLGYLKTEQARAKVRHWFHQESYQRNHQDGENLWEKTYPKVGFPKNSLSKIYAHFNFKSVDDLLAAMGSGDIGIQSVLNRLRNLDPNTTPELTVAKVIHPVRAHHLPSTGVENIDNLLTQLARCCQPIPGDPILGYITKGRGITIHHQNCINIKQASKFRSHRIMAVNWGKNLPQKYPVDLIIEADDRSGLLRDISNVIAEEKITILSLTCRVDKRHDRAYVNLSIQIPNLGFLDKMTSLLQQIPEIISVKRR